MTTAAQAAALIAAIAFAVLAAAGVYALVKLARLASESTRAVGEFRTRGDLLLARANSAIDRAHDQIAKTDAITANMEDVSLSIAEMTADVSMLAGAVRSVLGGPADRFAGLVYGVRRAIAIRRYGGERLPEPPGSAIRRNAAVTPAALTAGRSQRQHGAGHGSGGSRHANGGSGGSGHGASGNGGSEHGARRNGSRPGALR